MGNEALISVIIPVYNAENCIENCLQSVLDQSYRNLEIILIDDGSIDNSGKISDAYSTNDNRIRVVHTANSGVSAARNLGLDMANGQYIAFIDSDDTVQQNYIHELYEAAAVQDSDIVCSGYSYTGKELKYQHNDFKNLENSRESFVANLLQNTGGTICSKLFKASIISDHQLRFDSTLKMREDLIFSLEFAFFANSFHVVHNYYYYYNGQNIDSLSSADNTENRLQVRNIIAKILEKHNFNIETRHRLLNIRNKEILFAGIRDCFNFKKPLASIQAFYRNSEISELTTHIKIIGLKDAVLYLPAKLKSAFLTFIIYRILYGNK